MVLFVLETSEMSKIHPLIELLHTKLLNKSFENKKNRPQNFKC